MIHVEVSFVYGIHVLDDILLWDQVIKHLFISEFRIHEWCMFILWLESLLPDLILKPCIGLSVDYFEQGSAFVPDINKESGCKQVYTPRQNGSKMVLKLPSEENPHRFPEQKGSKNLKKKKKKKNRNNSKMWYRTTFGSIKDFMGLKISFESFLKIQ